MQPPSEGNAETKTAFRKPSNDAANRKYRRHSPISGSSSPNGSPKGKQGSSPIILKENDSHSDYRQRSKDGGRDDRDFGRNPYRSGDSFRHSDRQSSRSSDGYSKHDDYARHDRRGDEEERTYHRLPYRSCRDSKTVKYSDHVTQDKEHYRSRDCGRNLERYSYDKHDAAGYKSKDKESESLAIEQQKYRGKDLSDRSGSSRRHSSSDYDGVRSSEREKHIRDKDVRDEQRDYNRSSGDRSDCIRPHEGSRGRQGDSTSARDKFGYRSKESHKSQFKEIDTEKHVREDKKTYGDGEKDHYSKEKGKLSECRTDLTSESEESSAKKPKLFSLNEGTDNGNNGEEQPSNAKQAHEIVDKMASGYGLANSSGVSNEDINAAKVAAMKAAELVNRNLTGVGYMSTEQKKKLLWGNKKSTAVEEPGHRWDSTLFPDRERQEKFNKLMGVKGESKVEHNTGNQGNGDALRAEKQKELQLDLEKQYTAGLRRRDGRTVGLGL